jgi:quinol-cytochrome oxidoreductase complex cytochrome b subunit/mono/diheme cytochrome c family protein
MEIAFGWGNFGAVRIERAEMNRVAEWLERRTGLHSALRKFADEEIPASSGWAQVFGSVTLFLFLTHAFTGILLTLNYAPSPGEAYDSVLYITRSVSSGRMIRGLHHWGASMMIVVLVLHASQVFLYGAYKKPREALWITGVLMSLLVLSFGLTGYLLPWDNRAYWGTVVVTQIAGQAPLLGPYLQNILGARNGIGAVTFSRFYSLHTVILPAGTALLAVLHIMLVRKHGVTPAPGDDAQPKKRFYPEQVFRDSVAMFIAFALLFLAAAFLDLSLERVADPTDATYTPRPEWYFLFLFQTLKLFQGRAELVGSILLPTLAVIALIAVPFLDRGHAKRVKERTLAITTVLFCLAAWSSLTIAAVRGTPPTRGVTASAAKSAKMVHFAAEELAALGYFREQDCTRCHNLLDGDPKPGPTLAGHQNQQSGVWLEEHLKNSLQGSELTGAAMRSLSAPQLNALLVFVSRLTPEKAFALSDVPANLTAGADAYVSHLCASCHRINGEGGESGPPLNGLAARRSQEWVRGHFRSPRAFSPGSIMPAYHLSQVEEDALVSYLFQLP